ncbi:MAG: transcription termination/antitermination NusG family protein [Saccharofermentanales bacterium]
MQFEDTDRIITQGAGTDLNSQTIQCYCLFVRSGSEQSVADAINLVDEHFQAMAPKRTIQEKTNRQWSEKTLALLPGYVFVYTDDPDQAPFQRRVNKMYKVLRYNPEMRALIGEDLDYALWVYRNHGDITPSRIYLEGDEIRVVDGPLLDCTGKIIRLDKHKRRATVEFDFDGCKRIVSLSAEVLTTYERRDNTKFG